MDISLPENDYFPYEDLWLKDEDTFLESDSSSPQTSPLSPCSDPPSVLCGVCKQTVLSLPALPFKRTRNEPAPVCSDCLALTPGDLPKFRHASAKSKRVVKREHARRRTKDTDSEAVRQLKAEQAHIATGDYPEPEKKRLFQVLRNRISAQQSRDRKKAYIDQLELDKKELESKNLALEQKIARLKFENRLLKRRIALQSPESDGNSGSSITRTVRNVTIALATVISVVALVQNMGEKETLQTLELKEFRNDRGVTVEEATGEVLRTFNLSVEELVRQVSEEAKVEEMDVPNILDPALYFDLSSIRGSLGSRIQDKTESDHVALRGSHPCDGYRDLLQAYESNSLATMFCPNLSFYTSIGHRLQDMVRMVQMVVPVSTMVETLPELKGMENCYLELLCKVLDVSVVSAK